MNNISILPQVGMHILQLQNVKRDRAQKMNIDVLNKENSNETEEKNEIKNSE
jgi:hypothetical protein